MRRRDFLRRCAEAAALAGAGGLARVMVRTADAAAPPGAAPAVVSGPAGAVVERWTRSACDLCGLGEPVFLGSAGNTITAVKGIPASPVGFGRLCVRARALTAASGEHRLLHPMVRKDPSTKGRLEGLEPAGWDEALALVRDRFAENRRRAGANANAFLLSDGETNETYLLAAKLAGVVFGTGAVDTPARLDALHAYAAAAEVFGVPANAASLEDVDAATLIILVGGDIAESHPSLYYRLLDSRRAGRSRVVLMDPRKTLAAGIADLHLRPPPGGELAFIAALAARVVTAEVLAEAATKDPSLAASSNISEWRRAVASAHAAADDLKRIATLWHEARGVVTLVGPSVLSSPDGASVARLVAQLHRASGQWGFPGRGCLFLPRGANAAGVVLFGATPRPGATPALGWPAEVAAGRIAGLFLLRGNPAAEMPAAGAWRDALDSAFVVAATAHEPTETTVHADLVLPLALVSGESEGTMLNLDRRCHLLEAAASPPGEARTAYDLMIALARAALPPADYNAKFARYAEGPHVAWEEWRTASAASGADMRGMRYDRLRKNLGLKWPCAADGDPGLERLVPPGTPRRFIAPPHAALASSRAAGRDRDRPLLLAGGPLREHFRSRVETGLAPELHYGAPVARIEMNPADGSALGFADGDWVTLESAEGELTARLWITDRSPKGMVFCPEHYGFLSDLQGGTDGLKEPEGLLHLLTTGELVPGSGSPAGLLVAVSARKAKRRELRRRGLRRPRGEDES